MSDITAIVTMASAISTFRLKSNISRRRDQVIHRCFQALGVTMCQKPVMAGCEPAIGGKIHTPF
jgi:hypothetical protein